MGAERSVGWLGSVGPLEVGVLVEVDPGLDPLSWIWTGILVGATMLCCCGEAASSSTQVRRCRRSRVLWICAVMCLQGRAGRPQEVAGVGGDQIVAALLHKRGSSEIQQKPPKVPPKLGECRKFEVGRTKKYKISATAGQVVALRVMLCGLSVHVQTNPENESRAGGRKVCFVQQRR